MNVVDVASVVVVVEVMSTAFDTQPILEWKLITLRPLTALDFAELYQVASDPLIWDQHPFPRYEKAAFTEFFDQSMQSKSGLVIIDRQTQKMIGASRYYDLKEDQVAIGYTFLARSYWGGVFNRELKTLMIEHALKYVGQVFFDIGEDNKRSRRAIEKIGASFVQLQTRNGKPYTQYRIDKVGFQHGLGSLPNR